MSLIADAIQGRAERVPVAPLITTGHASRMAGIKVYEYVVEPEKLAMAQSKTRAFYDYDWTFAHIPFQGVTPEEKANMVKGEDHVILRLEFGTEIKIPARGAPQTIRTAIQEKADLDTLEFPDTYAEERLRPMKLLLEREDFVCGNLRCPFTMASTFLYGLEPFLIDLKTDEAFARRLLDRAVEYGKAMADAYIEAGCHALFMEDPSASSSVISPKMYRDFAQPYEKALVDEIGGRVPVIFHICGDISQIVDGMIETGADCISLDEAMDLHSVHQKTPVWGNVSPDRLVRGEPDEIYDISKDITALKDRVVLSSGCVVPGNANPENIKAMVRAAKG
jgi:MtaA/CmuA family methyltransferase